MLTQQRRSSPEGLALSVMRQSLGWTQKRLASALRRSTRALESWENGSRHLTESALRDVGSEMGYEPAEVDILVLAMRGLVDPVQPPAPGSPAAQLPPETLRHVRREAILHGLTQAQEFEARRLAEAQAAQLGREREAAEALVRRLLPRSHDQRVTFLEGKRGFGCAPWAFVERACEQSLRELPRSAEGGLAWARLALRFGVDPDPLVDRRLAAYAWAFYGYSLLAKGDLVRAENSFGQSRTIWADGRPAAVPVAEWRMLELEAALYRDQALPGKALWLHELALEIAEPASLSLLHLSKAETLEGLGDFGAALDSLQLAQHYLGASEDPRLRILLGWKIADLLCRSGRSQETIPLLAEVRKLALNLGSGSDVARCLWIQARIESEHGQADRALGCFQQARADFSRQQQAHESAEIALEIVELYLQLGEVALARKLIEEIGWIETTPRFSETLRAAIRELRESALGRGEMFPWVLKGLAELRKTRPRTRP